MYCCLDCDLIFEDPIIYRGELLQIHDILCREEWHGCPTCGGAYAKTYRCDICDDYIIGEYMETKNKQLICDKCYKIKDVADY